jgi:alpha-methylacyl-CoA racemase
MAGPLEGFRIIEFAGLGPGPFCAMMLADMGADIIRLDRKGGTGTDIAGPPGADIMQRGRRSVVIDLKDPRAIETVFHLIEKADALIEGYRPGVMEKFGLGPQDCLARNPRLVYGRMTGWGQDGPWAQRAGHDITYIALAGALWTIGRPPDKPVVPLNLVGDFGGGGMLLGFGLLAALLEAQRSGLGQVVDAAMVDGTASLMTMVYALRNLGVWSEKRGDNLLDSGAPFYEVYETADGEFIAMGPIEPQFMAEFMARSGLDGEKFGSHFDRSRWPAQRAQLTDLFKSRTRAEWCALFEGSEACVAPVLSPWEAPEHPHLKARGTFVEVDGVVQPAPAPRFSRTPAATPKRPPRLGEHSREALAAWGIAPGEIDDLKDALG